VTGILALAVSNLLTPMILCFVLGLAAALARSDLSMPEAAAKAMSLYLLFAIGFKGGAAVSVYGVGFQLVSALAAGVLLSVAMPFVAFGLLRAMTRLSIADAAAVAAHYGSISIVTFVTATSVLQGRGIAYEGFMVAVAAAMEAPAIIAALWIVAKVGDGADVDSDLWREVLLNGSIVLLVGSFAIGAVTGESGMSRIESFIVSPFQGVLCLFLLDMGLVAGRGLRASGRMLGPGVVLFGLLMPMIGAGAGLLMGAGLGLSVGGVALLMTLAASASYIAVPAAMRVALPEANPGIYLTLSLGVTFPFNLAVGIPLYVVLANSVVGV